MLSWHLSTPKGHFERYEIGSGDLSRKSQGHPTTIPNVCLSWSAATRRARIVRAAPVGAAGGSTTALVRLLCRPC